jgi:selenocysteine lyase/cysteine desulfurase
LGFEVIFFGDAHPGLLPADLTGAVDDAQKTAGPLTGKSAVLASHVNYLSGVRLNLEALAALCKARDMLCCVNATQSFGALPIDVSCGVDMLFGTGLKWAQAGFGTGFVYIRQQLVDRLGLPKLTGWLSVPNPGQMDNRGHEPLLCAKSLDMGGGAPPFQNIMALGGALEMRATIGNGDIRRGVAKVEHRMLENAGRLRHRFVKLGLELLLPSHRPQPSGIVSVVHSDAPEIVKRLEEQGVYVTLRRHPQLDTQSIIRFGVAFFIRSSEIDRAATVMETIIKSLRES